jgi:hypothetical protein
MNEQKQLQIKRSGMTIMLIGGVTLLIWLLIFLLLAYRWGPYPSGGHFIVSLTIPLNVQGAILLFLGGGWDFVIGLSLMKKFDKSLMLISSIPLFVGFLTYLVPQLVADVSNSYPDTEMAYHAAFLVVKLLFIVGSLHLIIGVVAWSLGVACRLVTKLAHGVN